MANIVEIRDLSKQYMRTKALDNVDINIKQGRIVGILGPNGSGKTSLMKIIAGILRQTRGEILIDGLVPGPATKAIVSYLPDRNFLYSWM